MLTIRFASVTTMTCALFAVAGCSSNSSNPSTATGGATATGGTTAAGGETSAAGDSSVAGTSNGGSSNGGASNGGTANGGASAVCTAGQTRCNQGVPQTCNAGAWQDGTACTGLNYCSAGTCVPCGGTGGPTLVALQEAGFCVDSTEVTRSQYKQWLDTNPSTSSQTSNCTWNTDFTPSDPSWPPTDKLDFPARGIDWCDAYAYCQAVGKRLCGAIAGGTNPYANYAARTGQWMSACSANGRSPAYPYSGTYSKTACNGTDAQNADTVAVGSLSTCQSYQAGYTGVFDMSGNVQEWEDSCDETSSASASDVRCRVRGGSYLSTFDKLTCNGDFYAFRSYTSLDIGFRCCSK